MVQFPAVHFNISNNTEQVFLSGEAVILLFFFFPVFVCFDYLNINVWDWQGLLTMAGSCCSGILLYHKSFFATVLKLVSIVSRLVLVSKIKLNGFVTHFQGWAILIVK